MNSQVLRILAIALALGAVLLGYFAMQLSQGPERQEPLVTEEAPGVPEYSQVVVIARHEIEAGRQLRREDLESVPYPVRRKGAFDDAGKLLDRIVVSPLAAGEIVLESHFHAGSPIAHLLASGERAMAISVTEVIGGGGYVQPGDYVDVLLYLRGGSEVKHSVARTVIEHVQVLAYGKSLAVNKGDQVSGAVDDEVKRAEASTRTAVLAVSREDVEKLMLAENAGVIRLAVVSSRETEAGWNRGDAKRHGVGIDDLAGARRPRSVAGIPVYRGSTRTFETVSQ